MRTLFEISDDLAFLEDFLTDTGGDVTDEQLEAEIDKWLASLGDERDAKIDNYCALIKELYAKAEARKAEAARIAGLGQVDENAADRLKARLFAFFVAHKIDKVETLRFKVARQKNGGKLPVILDKRFQDDPANLPEAYRKTVYIPKTEEIGTALAAGEELGFAWLGERGEHLRIR